MRGKGLSSRCIHLSLSCSGVDAATTAISIGSPVGARFRDNFHECFDRVRDPPSFTFIHSENNRSKTVRMETALLLYSSVQAQYGGLCIIGDTRPPTVLKNKSVFES